MKRGNGKVTLLARAIEGGTCIYCGGGTKKHSSSILVAFRFGADELADIDHQFRQAILGSAIGVAVADRQRRLLRVNRAFCRITGYTEEELLSMDWAPLTHPADRARNLVLARQMYAGKLRQVLLEKRYIKKSGEIVWVRNSTSILEENGGKPITFLALVEDITELKRSESEVRQLSTQVMNLQDEERRRIARELHDTTAQNLAALLMTLARVRRRCSQLGAESRRDLEFGSRLARQIAQEIRTVSYLLHPPMLDELGVAQALRWYVRGFSQRSGVEVTLKLPDDMRRFPTEIETALFRIVQESLNNVRRHSGGTRAIIRLHHSGNRVRLLVRDFGKGIRAGSNDDGPMCLGVGIPGMQERVRQFGGELHIRSGKTGTLLEAVIPLPRPAAEPFTSTARKSPQVLA